MQDFWVVYYRGPQPPSRDPLSGRGRIPTGSWPTTGPWKNSYRVVTHYRAVEEFLPGRDPLPGRGRIPTGSWPTTGPWKNSYRVVNHYRAVEEFLPGRENVLGKIFRYDDLLFIVRKLLF